jgi:F-type H+-transporting ATPase subunit delta
MSASAVADRYARAIFELGVEGGTLAQLTQQIGKFAETYAASPELRAVLDNPVVETDKREAVLKDVAARLGLSPLATTAIRYIASRRRLRSLPDIARRLGTLSDEKEGIVRATVTAAAPLPESFYEKLKGELESITGRKIVLDRREDPSLIAGVVTRIGDNTIDGSLRGRLEHIERQLVSAS